MSDSTVTFRDIPIEELAHILTFLPTESIAALCATNQRLRIEVPPFVKKLTITSPRQMQVAVAQRFQNVEELTLWGNGACLIEQPRCFSQLIPFLSSFPNLERVAFSDVLRVALALMLQLPLVEGGSFGPNEHDTYGNPIETVVHLLCEAYRTEELSSNVRVEKLFCPWPHQQDHPCRLCRHVLKNFPFLHLLGEDEHGAPTLTFLDVPGVVSSRRDIERWMAQILVDRLEQIPRALGFEAAMILHRALNGEA